MAPQSVEVAETITNLRRKLKRDREAPSSQPITSATNRGNKLKKGANLVHAGSLPYQTTAKGYRERIEHAGFTRYILERNPTRYNDFGDELADSDSEDGADVDANDENPYSNIRLEELLRPLTHPAELEGHPTLSHPYLDSALEDMVLSTEQKLRQERANLWRAKNLHRQFIGDESWIPAGKVEAPDDWDLFEPALQEPARSSHSDGLKGNDDVDMMENGIEGHDHAELATKDAYAANNNMALVEQVQGNDTAITTGVRSRSRSRTPHAGASDLAASAAQHVPEVALQDTDMLDTGESKTNGVNGGHNVSDNPSTSNGTTNDAHVASTQQLEPARNTEVDKSVDSEAEVEDGSIPAPPMRRITRALAAEHNAPTPPLSPSSSTTSDVSASLLQPHPTFLLPASLATAHSTHPSSLPMHVAHSGLPLDEILETRRLLGMYIQKQEETIRGFEGVLGKLIKAKRMKEKVWDWSKAEAHVGECSDGEDWIDSEAWGVKEGELRKGRDEDEIQVEEEVGRGKGKRRRGRE